MTQTIYQLIDNKTMYDPLSDDYPNISPYAYCSWNPIKYLDPDGCKITIASNVLSRFLGKIGFNTYYEKVNKSLNQLKKIDPEIKTMIEQLEQSETTYSIKPISERPDKKEGNAYDHTTNIIYFDPDNNERPDGEKRDAIVGLVHELGHADNDEKGQRTNYNKEKARNGDAEEKAKWNKNEKNSIQKENIVRKELNLPLRDETYIK